MGYLTLKESPSKGTNFAISDDNLVSFYPLIFSRRKVKLYQLESRLGLSRSQILDILADSGYNVPNKPLYNLAYNHLLVLAKAYEKSLIQFFRKSKKEVHCLDEDSIKKHAKFFSIFIENSNQFDDVELFDQNLDSILIERWVIRTALADYGLNEFDNSFYNLLQKLKFNLRKLYRDHRIQIFSISLTHHYHVFPSEEDSSEKLNTPKSFSESSDTWIRKAIIKYYFIKALKHERNTNFNQQYSKEQFI